MKQIVEIVLIWLVASVSGSFIQIGNGNTGKYARFIADVTNDFNAKSVSTQRNMLVSPFSILLSLYALYFGANNVVQAEIRTALNLTGSDDELGEKVRDVLNKYRKNPQQFVMASHLFVSHEYPILETYSQFIEKYLNMGTTHLDFKDTGFAKNSINKWIGEATNNRITNLVSSLNPSMPIFLASGIYISTQWELPLSRSQTTLQSFYESDNSVVKIQMMRHRRVKVRYGVFHDLQARAVELRFQNSTLTLLIVLPHQRRGLKSLELLLNSYDTLAMARNLRLKSVSVSLPKFRIKASHYVKDVLVHQGVKALFDSRIFPDLTMRQTSFLEVSEGNTPMDEIPVDNLEKTLAIRKSFVANHPFAFYVQDKSDVYLSGSIRTMKIFADRKKKKHK